MPLALEHVAYSYEAAALPAIAALHDLSLKIGDGEFVGVMGHTGCGKTTLIQLMAGLLTPTQGRVLLDGSDINSQGYDRGLLRQHVGLVFQYPEYQLFATTVEKDVAFGLKHSGLGKSEINARVQWALETMGFSFDKIRAQSPLALSGGEKRRVAIAGVLAAQPKILIFDEPVAGLDPLGRQAFLRLVRQLNQGGTTVVMVSHNADALAEYAQRLVILGNGRLLLDGEAKAVFSDIGRMNQLRLGVSTPRLIADMLRRRGVDVPQDTICYDQLLAALQARLMGGDPL